MAQPATTKSALRCRCRQLEPPVGDIADSPWRFAHRCDGRSAPSPAARHIAGARGARWERVTVPLGTAAVPWRGWALSARNSASFRRPFVSSRRIVHRASSSPSLSHCLAQRHHAPGTTAIEDGGTGAPDSISTAVEPSADVEDHRRSMRLKHDMAAQDRRRAPSPAEITSARYPLVPHPSMKLALAARRQPRSPRGASSVALLRFRSRPHGRRAVHAARDPPVFAAFSSLTTRLNASITTKFSPVGGYRGTIGCPDRSRHILA